MVGEVVAAREPLVAVRAGVVPRARVLGHVALPVGLVGELQAALVADEGLDAAVRAHVRVEQRLPEVGLPAELQEIMTQLPLVRTRRNEMRRQTIHNRLGPKLLHLLLIAI